MNFSGAPLFPARRTGNRFFAFWAEMTILSFTAAGCAKRARNPAAIISLTRSGFPAYGNSRQDIATAHVI